ncbi:MAG: formate acetyltransferase [Lachnospiraceae bacterium]|nr:formate acetyltransferase [Lachnospiraceae bacterium]
MEKREIYNERIRKMREDVLEEMRKSGTHIEGESFERTIPPGEEGDALRRWRPISNSDTGDFYGYMGCAVNFAGQIETFPIYVASYSSMVSSYYGSMVHQWRKTFRHPSVDFGEIDPLVQKYVMQECYGMPNHFCGDVRIGLELGWGGLLEKLIRCRENNRDKNEQTREFYEAEILFVEAVISWIRRTSLAIEKAMEQENHPDLRENLRQMLCVNRNLETKPPATFREACQFLCWYNVVGCSYNGDGAGCQLDVELLPYYEKDIAEGRIDEEDAVYYLCGLLVSCNKFHQICGLDENGQDIDNRLSWLVLEALRRLNLPSDLTFCVHSRQDPKIFRRAVELLCTYQNAWPRFMNADALAEGFMANGFDREDAYRRVMGGCHWLSAPGKEYTLSDATKINLAKVFELAFEDMMQEGNPSMERLQELFECHMRIAMDVAVASSDNHLRTFAQNMPELFLNLFCHGPVEKGRDVSNHSVRYYNLCMDGTGIAVAADSFAALEQRVVREKRLTWEQVWEALKCNYEGEARIVRSLLQTAEKYGQGNNLGQKWAERLTGLFTEATAKLKGAEGQRFLPGMYSWRHYLEFGKHTGATPDGRLAGMPLNHNANPTLGVIKNGEMTVVSEAIVGVQCGRGNTSSWQLDLDPMIGRMEDGVDKVAALIKTHFQRGGTLITPNIIDSEKILAANENPDLYPDLVVRVTGYSANFRSLTPELRQLIVDRIVKG